MDPSPPHPTMAHGFALAVPAPVPSPLTSALTPLASGAATSDSHLLDEFESRNENIRSLLFDPAASDETPPHSHYNNRNHIPSIIDYNPVVTTVDQTLSSSTALPSIQAIVADTSSLPASYASVDSDLTEDEEEFETEGAAMAANHGTASNSSAMRVDTSISEQLPELSRIIDALSPSAIIRYSTPPISATPSLQSSPTTLSSSAAMGPPTVARLTMSRYPSGSNQASGATGTPLGLPSPFRSQSGSRRSSNAPPMHTLSPPPQVITPQGDVRTDDNGVHNRTPLSNTHIRTAMVHMQAQMQAYVDQSVAQIHTQLNEYVKQHLQQLEQQLNSNDPNTVASALSALSMPLPRLDATALSSSPPFATPSVISTTAARRVFNLDTHSNAAIAPFLSPLHSVPQRFPSPFVRQPTPSSTNHQLQHNSNAKPDTPVQRTMSGVYAGGIQKTVASPLRPTVAILQSNVPGSTPTAPESSPSNPSL